MMSLEDIPKVTFTRNVEQWGPKLQENFEKQIEGLKTYMNEFTTNMKAQLADIFTEINIVSTTAKSALELAKQNEISIRDIKRESIELKKESIELKKENNFLRNKMKDLETFSRKDNLLIYGLHEPVGESAVYCSRSVKKLFVDVLELEQATVDSMIFTRCHRVGMQRLTGGSRSILVRFRSFTDRSMVWSARLKLKETRISLAESFDTETAYNRRKLFPIFKKAISVSKKVTLKGDRLYVDGNQYGVDCLEKLPEEIHPKHMTRRQDGKTLVFGGYIVNMNPLVTGHLRPLLIMHTVMVMWSRGNSIKKPYTITTL